MVKQRIGLLGGSFDPVHIAHIALANAALYNLQLHQVQLLPASQPWQKGQLGASAPHRLAMLELACAPYQNLVINPIEIERGGTTYTYETVSQLPSDKDYFWILGSDQIQNFTQWHNWQGILNYVSLAVAKRPGSSLAAPPELDHYLRSHNKVLHHIDFAPTPISATLIRERLQQHQSVASMVPQSVAHYIEQHHLYQPSTTPP